MYSLKILLKFYKKNWKTLIYSAIIFSFCIIIMAKFLDVQNMVFKVKDYWKEYYFEVILFAVLFIIFLRKTIKRYILYCFSSKYNNIDLIFAVFDLVLIIFCAKYGKMQLLFPFLRNIIIIQALRIFIVSIRIPEKDNTFWLHEVYNDSFELILSEHVFIREEESNIDLLNKQYEVLELERTIVKCRPEKTFFIGLDGKWGKGKTTLVNLVKKELHKDAQAKDILIVDFDPCKYSDCESMLRGFYNDVAEKINLKDSIRFRQALHKMISSISISGVIRAGVGINLSKFYEEIDVNKIICDELENISKRLLIIVDNLDRANTDVLNFFIRCTYSVTKFKHTIFLLLYDGDLLNAQLSKYYNTNNLFMNKIINMPIKMSETDKSKVNDIFKKSIKNLIEKGCIVDIKLQEIENINFYDDIRDVVRALNYSVHISRILEKLQLNYYDFLALLYIKDHDSELYNEVFRSREYLTYRRKYSEIKDDETYTNYVIKKINSIYGKAKDNTCKKLIISLFENMNDVINSGSIPIYKYREKRR